MSAFFEEYLKLHGIYRKYIGRKMYIIFLLSLMVVVMASFGIALLLPLVEIFDATEPRTATGEDAGLIMRMMYDFVSFFGVQDSIPGILLLLMGVFVLKGFVTFGASFYAVMMSVRLQEEIRVRMLAHYENLSYAYYSENNTGYYINVIISQIYELINGFFSFKDFNVLLIQTAVYLLFSFMISWQFTLMAAAGGGLYLIVFRPLNGYVRNLSRKTTAEYTVLNTQLVQTMQGFKYLSATSRLHLPLNRVVRSIRVLVGYLGKIGTLSSIMGAIREPLSVAMVLGIMVVQITVFEAAIAPIIVSLILIHRAFGQLMSLQSSWMGVVGHTGSVEVVEKEMKNLRDNQLTDGTVSPGPLKDAITLQDICFSYRVKRQKEGSGTEAGAAEGGAKGTKPEDGLTGEMPFQYESLPDAVAGPGGKEPLEAGEQEQDQEQGFRMQPVLKGLNLRIGANKTVAFVGESGSGKSTLVDLIMMLHRPQQGRMLIDGTDSAQVRVAAWRQQIGYVSQESVIFDDTVANNICMWDGDYKKDPVLAQRLRDAAKAAHALDFIENMPDGFDTEVGDRGTRLSGGQKQRLCIARELFKQPRVLILDEATSALDSESEHIIRQSIESLKGKLTLIIVAHRLSTIRNADKIYMIRDGKVAEQGTYDELVARGGGFARSAKLQRID